MKLSVDLNADLGEGVASENDLLPLISSASIACGLHAGDPSTMVASIRAAQAAGVMVGAHPSLNDRKNFGRTKLAVSPDEVFALVVYQLGAFQAMATSLGEKPRHIKLHGALYNMAARDDAIAQAAVQAIIAIDPSLILFCPGGSALAEASTAQKLHFAREVFADRNYLSDGSLVPRTRADALLHDPQAAATRVLRMLQDNVVVAIDGTEVPMKADTVCVHGDTPDAILFARELHSCLTAAGISIAAASA
jgi:UPF0271 protein